MDGRTGGHFSNMLLGRLRGVDLSRLEETSTHKSAKIHASNVFVIRDLDL